MKVACYGSLKEGFYNHPALRGAPLVGTSTTRGEMYLMGNSYPELMAETDSNPENVREHEVEVYDVEPSALDSIDRMERGAGYYSSIEEFTLDDGSVVDAIIYRVKKNHGGRFIEAYTHEAMRRSVGV